MASMDRQKLVEDKKQELLRRIAEKKKNSQTIQPPLPSSYGGAIQIIQNPAPSGPKMFVNDGNFLARFQAMQQQQKTQEANSSSTATTGAASSSDCRPTVSMKLTTVKKSTPAKPARPDVFETPEEIEENGNLKYLKLRFLLAWYLKGLDCSHTFVFGVILISLNAWKCSDERYN